MQFFGGHQRKSFLQVETHLVTKTALSTCACTIRFIRRYPKYAEEDRGIAAWPQINEKLRRRLQSPFTVGNL